MGRVVALILAIVNVTLAATIDLTKQNPNGKRLTITVSLSDIAEDGDLWITNNFNYEQQTFVANKTDYDFEFVDIVGERISFWVQTPTGERIAESALLVTPMSPQIRITCGQNCEDGMVTVNFANNDFDNLTISHYMEEGNILLMKEVVYPAQSSTTFFTYQPGRLERFDCLGIIRNMNASTSVHNRVSPLPLDFFDYSRPSLTNSSVMVMWDYSRDQSHFDYVEIFSNPPNLMPDGPIRVAKDQTNVTLTNFTSSYIHLTATTKTNEPIAKSSAPKMINLYLIPAAIDPLKLRVTPAVNLDGFSVSWPKPRAGGTISEYRLAVQYASDEPDEPNEAKVIPSSKTGMRIGGLKPGHIYRIRIWTVKSWEKEQLISTPTESVALLGPAPVKQLQPVPIRTSTRSMQFQWEAAEGTYTGYNISWSSAPDCFEQIAYQPFYDAASAKRSEKMGTQVYKLDGLQPNCDYYFNITTFLAAEERYGLDESTFVSETITAEGRTEKEPPRVLDLLEPTSINVTTIEETQFTVDLNVTNFRDDYGEITYYAVWIRTFQEDNDFPYKPGKVPIRWTSEEDTQWVAIWIDAKKYGPTGGFLRSVVIGDKSLSAYERISYLNSPLKSGTQYQLAVAAVNEIGSRDLYYSTKIETMTVASPAVIAATVVPISIVMIGAIGVGIYFYRRRHQFVDNDKEDQTDSNLQNGFHNNGFEPDLQMSGRTTKPIQLCDFQEAYMELRQDSGYKFSDEFFELKEVGKSQPVEASLLPANRGKNRYTNILAYDRTRVKLNAIDDENADDNGSDYINANYIQGNNSKREFIATQGPLPATKEDFWRMAWEQKSPIIVALCQLNERGRIKCDHYWPYDNESEWLNNDLNLTMTRESTLPEWTEREFVLIRGEERRHIKQFHFTVWPDNGVPNPLDPLVRFVRQVRREMNRFPNAGPTIIHCSAGVGRTGTFVGVDKLIQDFEKEASVDIFGLVYQMRMARCLMVQTEAQYICLHEVIYEMQRGKYNLGDPQPVEKFDEIADSTNANTEPFKEPPGTNIVETALVNETLQSSSSSSNGSFSSDSKTRPPRVDGPRPQPPEPPTHPPVVNQPVNTADIKSDDDSL